MQPYKKQKMEGGAAADPFEDDWEDDDDILRLVESEVPTYSQMSQAIRAPPINKPYQSNNSNGAAAKRSSFVFKKPSSVTSKPASYTCGTQENYGPSADLESEISKPLSQWANTTQSNGTSSTSADNTDVSAMKKQIADLIRKQHGHEGEIKWLRSTLKDKDSQMTSLRTNINADSAKLKLQSSEKERGFVRDIETLRSELQFKESELMSVTQALDKLKRDKSAHKAPAISVGADGFPSSTHGFGTSPNRSRVPASSKTVKTHVDTADSMEVDSQSVGSAPSKDESVCDLLPSSEYRLKPRTMSSSKFKQRMLVSNMLKSGLQTVEQSIDSATALSDRDKCMDILSDSLVCAKDLCYL